MNDHKLYTCFRVRGDRGFQASGTDRYRQITIEVKRLYKRDLSRYWPGLTGLSSSFSDQTAFKIRFQTDHDKIGQEDPWYAYRVDMNEINSVDSLNERAALVRRFMRKMNDESQQQPGNAINALISMGAQRVEYDGRVSEFLLFEDVPGPHLTRWMDDSQSLGDKWNHASVLATNEDQARAALAVRMAESGTGLLERWVAGGMPVKEINGWGSEGPDCLTFTEWFTVE